MEVYELLNAGASKDTSGNSGVYVQHNFGCAPECREYIYGRGCAGCPRAENVVVTVNIKLQGYDPFIKGLNTGASL